MYVETGPCSICGGTGTVDLEEPSIPQEFQADYFTWVAGINNV
ncbi:MAG: hypothetical protein PHI74_06915 [Methanocellales archaeon]|nr:hypothetical protein [Methanocellales archaeon]